MKTTPCRGCGKPIVFAAITKRDGTNGTVPLDPRAPVYDLDVDVEGNYFAIPTLRRFAEAGDEPVQGSLVSHFATCPKAGDFSASNKGVRDALATALRHEEELRAAIMMLPKPPAEMGDGPHERVGYALRRLGFK